MPDDNGLELLPRIKRVRPDLRVIVMSARNTLLTAVRAAERGAFDYLPKPFDLDELATVVERALTLQWHAGAGEHVRPEPDDQLPLIGRSPAMQEIYRVIARLTGTDLTVLIVGESGTGKELVARALHDYGRRRGETFTAINMAAIPRELVESELFGHEKGAFTGAVSRSSGRFEQARGGTLFLDEIGDMPLDAQTRLLRVLQDGQYTTIGGREPIRADVRIIAATHRDLRQLIREGRFREDLFHRLNVVPLRLPPLHERTEDMPALARHFLKAAADAGLPAKILDSGALEELISYDWPGNVRELQNLLWRVAALHAQDVIDADVIRAELAASVASARTSELQEDADNLGAAVTRHLRAYFAAHQDTLPAAGLYGRVLREVERPLIDQALRATRGNQLMAANLLGLNRNTLRKKIRDLDISVLRGMK